MQSDAHTPDSFTSGLGGAVRWADAALFAGMHSAVDSEEDEWKPPPVTYKSDVYSLGSVMLEVPIFASYLLASYPDTVCVSSLLFADPFRSRALPLHRNGCPGGDRATQGQHATETCNVICERWTMGVDYVVLDAAARG